MCISLKCVKQHKMEQECTGVRCKTAYVPLEAFSDQHLLSGEWWSRRVCAYICRCMVDYYFLEEMGRIADSTHRSLVCFNRENAQNKRKNQSVSCKARIQVSCCIVSQAPCTPSPTGKSLVTYTLNSRGEPVAIESSCHGVFSC